MRPGCGLLREGSRLDVDSGQLPGWRRWPLTPRWGEVPCSRAFEARTTELAGWFPRPMAGRTHVAGGVASEAAHDRAWWNSVPAGSELLHDPERLIALLAHAPGGDRHKPMLGCPAAKVMRPSHFWTAPQVPCWRRRRPSFMAWGDDQAWAAAVTWRRVWSFST